MTTQVEKSILVNVPVSIAYNQWTQFEDFPQFMGGIKSVKQLEDNRLEWVAEIAGVRRQWTARILEQVPDQKVAWAATEGATNAGAVTFEDVGGGQTSVHLSLEYEPEGLLEKVATSSTWSRTRPKLISIGSRHSSKPKAMRPVLGADRSARVPTSAHPE